jgi:nitrous-oxide reductase
VGLLRRRVLDKISVHYNIGHLMTMEGDSMDPKGRYLVALNKLSIDRFNPVGPLHPQNHQLIDISNDKMQLLYDMPLPLGEPHYVVAIEASKLKPGVRYKVGTNSRTDKPHRAPSVLAKKQRQEGQQDRGLRHADPFAHHAGNHRG